MRPVMEPILEEHRRFIRRIYQYRQKIAPYVEGQFPSPDQFFEVQCKDISPTGIAFLTDKHLPYRWFVAALGQDSAISYFLLEVVRSYPVNQDGQKWHLLGCKFRGRIIPPAGFQNTPSSQAPEK